MKTVIVPFRGPPAPVPRDGLWNCARAEMATKKREVQAAIFVSVDTEETLGEFAGIDVLVSARVLKERYARSRWTVNWQGELPTLKTSTPAWFRFL